MLAVQIDGPGPVSALTVRSIDEPPTGPGEVKVEFLASSIHPADVKIRTGSVVPRGGGYPYTLGYDLVGTVVDGGAGVPAHLRGRRIAAMSAMAITGRGTWAERVCLPYTSVALLPEDADAQAMARLPLVGLTAYQAMMRAGVTSDQAVLVAGAAGAVGRVLVELLLDRGVSVHALVRSPEQASRFEGTSVEVHVAKPPVQAVDVVIDAAGGEFDAALKDGGVYVSVVPDQVPSRELLAARLIERAVVVTRESGEQLSDLVALVDKGVVTLEAPVTMPIHDIHAAHKEYEQHGQRNIVLTLDRS